MLPPWMVNVHPEAQSCGAPELPESNAEILPNGFENVPFEFKVFGVPPDVDPDTLLPLYEPPSLIVASTYTELIE